jgi:hypothetical protein
MPSPSYFPIVASFGLLVIAYGMILGHSNGTNYVVAVIGGLITIGSLYAWGLEPSAEPEEEHAALDDHHQPALVGAPPADQAAIESQSSPTAPSGSATGEAPATPPATAPAAPPAVPEATPEGGETSS